MLRRILPHISILLSNMYIVFFLIDRVNRAMAFIDNDLTKWLLLFASLISIGNAVFLIANERKRVALAEKRRRQRAAAARAAAKSAAPRPNSAKTALQK